jgi:uncharacterized small protein (DUF1192 family)
MANYKTARQTIGDVPEDVLDYMSPAEVAAMIAELRAEADRLEAWNKQRGHWQEPAPRWPVAPPPRSQDDYGKVRVR